MSSELIFSTVELVTAIIPIAVAVLALSWFAPYFKRSKEPIEAEVEKVRRRITDTPGQVPEARDKQYLLLREYHAQGLAQSKISFWFSLVFASLGFVVIISAIF